MKRKTLWVVAMASLLIMSGCSKQPEQQAETKQPEQQQTQEQKTENNESEKQSESAKFDITKPEGIQDFTKAFVDENKKISSVRLNLDGDYDFFGHKINSELETVVVYDTGSQKPNSYYIIGKGKDHKDNNQGEVVFQAPNERYRRANDGAWEPFPNAEPDRIDYHGFVGILTDILEDEKYEIKENGNFYDVVVTDKSYDFVKKLQGQMNFSFTDVKEEEINRELTFQVDKETLYLHTVKVILKYDAPSGKKLDVDAKVKMSEWNEADTSVIEKSLEAARKK